MTSDEVLSAWSWSRNNQHRSFKIVLQVHLGFLVFKKIHGHSDVYLLMGCALFWVFLSCIDTVKIKETFGSENECKSGISQLGLQRTKTVQVSHQIISKP